MQSGEYRVRWQGLLCVTAGRGHWLKLFKSRVNSVVLLCAGLIHGLTHTSKQGPAEENEQAQQHQSAAQEHTAGQVCAGKIKDHFKEHAKNHEQRQAKADQQPSHTPQGQTFEIHIHDQQPQTRSAHQQRPGIGPGDPQIEGVLQE